MKYYSTNNRSNLVSFSTAVKQGIADDGGLFMPEQIPKLPGDFLERIGNYSFQEIAFRIAERLIGEDIPERDLRAIISKSFSFPAPLVNLEPDKYVLELFHGPTLAFKDFGARFMANTISYLTRNDKEEINILVATSGDTGSAVANGFYNAEGIRVVLLYPSGKVSRIQEQQLTTLNKNVTAVEVDGTFDDCQRIVKSAFADRNLNRIKKLSSANSINIARLLPQSFYYFSAYAALEDKSKKVIFSVPSGNLGNLTGGIFAMEMGLPVARFIAAVNANDVVSEYLRTGIFEAKPTIPTISNAMDVGNPSNFTRIAALYKGNHSIIKKVIYSRSYTDNETRSAVKEVFRKNNYLLDPHGAVGYLALKDYLFETEENHNSIILETAHPAKFADIIQPILDVKIEVPETLASCMNKQKKSIKLSNSFEEFKTFLLDEIK